MICLNATVEKITQSPQVSVDDKSEHVSVSLSDKGEHLSPNISDVGGHLKTEITAKDMLEVRVSSVCGVDFSWDDLVTKDGERLCDVGGNNVLIKKT